MHALLAKFYHLGLRFLFTPLWRPPVAALLAGLILRLLGPGRAGLGACLAVLCGWLALVLPGNPFHPAGPVARLPVAAGLLTIFALLRGGGSLPPWLGYPLFLTVAAWWLGGAPLTGNAVANLVPLLLGLFAAGTLARRLAARDDGTATIAAAVALAASVQVAGGAAHWSRAALVPACAGLALFGQAEAVAPLAQAIVLVAATTILASNRGRFVPVDLAAAAPFLVWLIAPRLLPRLNRAGPVLAAGLAAACAVGVLWGATMLTHR